MRKDGRSPQPSPRPTSAATALSREGVSLPLSAALAMAGISIFGLLVFYVLNYHVLASGPPQPQLTAFGHYEDVTKNAWGALADMMQPYQPGKVRSILPRLEDGMLKQYEEALKCRRRWNRTAEDPKDRLAVRDLATATTLQLFWQHRLEHPVSAARKTGAGGWTREASA